ncbi:MAG: glutathione S-transferase family protein [Betaproteobacteria bacterium]
MYTLFYVPGSASMAIHQALLEIGAPHELKLIDLAKGAQREPAYLKLNPQGVVPTLVIDGRPMVESAALLMTLADRHPEAKLAPAVGTVEREAWYQWTVFLSNSLAATYRLWFYPNDLGSPAYTDEVGGALQKKIESVWDRLESHLEAGGPYMLGADISTVDLQLTMMMRWSRNMPRNALEWPHLKVLADKVRARDSWKKMCEREGLTEWIA